MIASGEKKEEYRETKLYWANRLSGDYFCLLDDVPLFRKFDQIIFTNGYGRNRPTVSVECKGIEIGTAKPEWSDNWQGDVFVIKLGNIISKT